MSALPPDVVYAAGEESVASLPPATGVQIWRKVFVWAFCSSVVLYFLAALIAFFTLRKHKFGRFYSLMILFMGFVLPLTLGVVSSGAIAFVYKTSSFDMPTFHALMWGCGQTLIHAFFGVSRLLATL